MLINLRNALMTGKRLPYEAEVEFLESTGTQYINTNIKPGPNTRAEIVFAMTTFTANCGLFGARDASSANLFYNLFIINNSGHRVRWDWCGKGDYKTSEAETSTAATYVLGAAGGHITRDGVSLMSVSSTKTALNQPLYIFNFNNNGSPYSTGANARFWSVKIYEGQTLVFDAIPVRKGTAGYLYDRVSGKLFGNAGTGDFLYGADVVPVEYIESHGTEYIDTGVHGSQNLRTTFDYQLVYSGTAPVAKGLFGYYSNGAKYHLYCSGAVPTFFQVGMGNAYANTLYVDNVRHSIEFNNSAVSIDGNVVATFEPYGYPTALTLLLFALHNASGSLYSMTPMRKWRVKMWDNGTPIRDYVSIRVGTDATSWEGAMMDVLTRRIYRNAGSGAFTYGNDLKYPIPSE